MSTTFNPSEFTEFCQRRTQVYVALGDAEFVRRQCKKINSYPPHMIPKILNKIDREIVAEFFAAQTGK